MLIHRKASDKLIKKFVGEAVLIVSDAFMHFTAVAHSIKQIDLKYIYKAFAGWYICPCKNHFKHYNSWGHSFSQLCHQNVAFSNQQDKLFVITLTTLYNFKKNFLEMLPFSLLGNFSEHGLSLSTTFASNNLTYFHPHKLMPASM